MGGGSVCRLIRNSIKVLSYIFQGQVEVERRSSYFAFLSHRGDLLKEIQSQ